MSTTISVPDSSGEKTDQGVSDNEIDTPYLLGYRKVIICALAIIMIAILAFFDVPHLERSTELIAWIAGGYCGINVFKSGISNNTNNG